MTCLGVGNAVINSVPLNGRNTMILKRKRKKDDDEASIDDESNIEDDGPFDRRRHNLMYRDGKTPVSISSVPPELRKENFPWPDGKEMPRNDGRKR